MDFTQHNKINCSVQKKFQNSQQQPQPSYQQTMPSFNQQSSQMYQNQSYPQQMGQNPMMQSFGMQGCYGQPQGQPIPQRSAGDMNWSFSPKTNFNPQSYPKDSRMSTHNNPIRHMESNFQEYEQQQNQEPDPSEAYEESNLDYFQCPPQTGNGQQQMSYPEMESMQQYAMPAGFQSGNFKGYQ